ncbi:MAG: PilZ domain-containing protein [Deltaproteobacteria bacterium]|nr:MAG: PilZ domain-containing protein [Deltaproteobacteria bacterium]
MKKLRNAMAIGKERRRHPRAEVEWPVTVRSSEGIMFGEVTNVSLGGAFIRCEKPLRVNQMLEMALYVDSLGQSIKATAEVVWSNIYGPDDDITPRGMGVRFTKISPRDRRLILTIVSKDLESGHHEEFSRK